jgi:hypothetical protein
MLDSRQGRGEQGGGRCRARFRWRVGGGSFSRRVRMWFVEEEKVVRVWCGRAVRDDAVEFSESGLLVREVCEERVDAAGRDAWDSACSCRSAARLLCIDHAPPYPRLHAPSKEPALRRHLEHLPRLCSQPQTQPHRRSETP